ncbi:spore germination protein [Ectobacillus panaciterrae]|uniref:spore germination protein n=1 Tax=Ectobacillus panaciterrae TaxID=363872 RepID=UPI000423972B|nr:spore germination protein [Ectobacillus panaciterrae]
MAFFINVFKNKVNGISQNGNVDFGTNTQNSHTANSKTVGACFILGDCCSSNILTINEFIDCDVSDQSQSDNPSSPEVDTP